MTSNIGSSYLLNGNKEKVFEVLKQTFRPEFINRIDEIVVFNALSKDVQEKIINKMLSLLEYRMNQKNIEVEFTDELKKYILNESYSFEYGARPIKRFIQKEIETVLALGIIKGEITPNKKAIIDYQNDQIIVK